MPIYGQILLSVTNVLIVVVILVSKLGVGGLIAAYKTTAQMVLETCEIIENDRYSFYNHFDYVNMNKVMQLRKKVRNRGTKKWK
jgi:putative IMPACT (imprinted ancient) family translation regulator